MSLKIPDRPAGITGFVVSCLLLSTAFAGDTEQVPNGTARSLRVAAVSVVQIHREIEGNLKRIEKWARKAAAADAELVLFPEAAISGWWQNREIRKYGEPVDGPSIQRLIKLAKELNIAMVVGMTETDGNKAYITQVFLDGNGIIGKHRKSSLAGGPDNGEQLTWDKGNDANVFNYKDIKIGIAICFESVHPETCRKLKANGAEIILTPHANGTKPSDLLNIEQGRENGKRVYLFDRARENRVWLVGCDDAPTNKDGGKEAGAAYVISPTSQLVKLSDPNDVGENMIVHTIELASPVERVDAKQTDSKPGLPNPGSPLDQLVEFKDYRAMRASSFDRSGHNADFLSDVMPGETAVLAELDGPGMISHLWITIDAEKFHGRTILLRMYWDDEKDPSVLCPINDFFCSGHGLNSDVRAMPVTCTSQGRARNCFFKMPFNRKARIEIENQGLDPIGKFYYYVDYRKYDQSFENAGYFHARYRQEYPAIRGQNYLICDARGQGHYVGTTLSVESNEDGWWGEGDDRIFIDGEAHPSFHGTGTEDYLSDAWGIWQGSSPYYGCTIHDSDKYVAGDRYTSYRFHIEDPIPFTQSLRFEFEDIGAIKNEQGRWISGDAERSDNWSSVAYWYQSEPHKTWEPIPPADQRLSREASEKARVLLFLRQCAVPDSETKLAHLRDEYKALMSHRKYTSYQAWMTLRMAMAELREGDRTQAAKMLSEVSEPFVLRALSADSIAAVEAMSAKMPAGQALLVKARDGSSMRTQREDRWAIETQRDLTKPHIYFAMREDAGLRDIDKTVRITVDYWTDGEQGRNFTIQYDSFHSNDLAGWHRSTDEVVGASDAGWHTVSVECERARLAGHQNERADFRIFASGNQDVYIGDARVELVK